MSVPKLLRVPVDLWITPKLCMVPVALLFTVPLFVIMMIGDCMIIGFSDAVFLSSGINLEIIVSSLIQVKQ